MNPLEYIEAGIREGNWDGVCEGYERLTGKALPIPTTQNKSSNNPTNPLQQIYDIVVVALEEPGEDEKPKKKKPGRPRGGKNKKKVTDDKVVEPNTNKTHFITNDPDPEEIEANKIKAERANLNKTHINRNTTKVFQVECNECEQKFDSKQPSGEIGQKCPACLRKTRSRHIHG